jgi:ParB/RepB/Spo0J family partition protein
MTARDKLPAMHAVQYRHPTLGMTWSGRGRKPRWVELWLEDGNSLDELRLAQAPEAPTPEPTPEPARLDAQHVPAQNLAPSPTNPRKTFPPDKIAEMAESIRRHGILQPILVRPWNGLAHPWPHEQIIDLDHPRFEIIAGERRWRAAQVAELALVPVLIRHLSDQETVEFQIIENLHREDLHPLEEAEGYELLMQRHAYSAEELADKIGKSKAYVYARLKLTALVPAAREAFRAGKLGASTALLVARIPGAALQEKYLADITSGWQGPMSYRMAAERAQNHYMLRLAAAPFDVNALDLADAGPCGTCPKRSGNQPELFADVASADVCTDPDCFGAKRAAWVDRQRAEAEANGKTIITGPAAEKIIPRYYALGETDSASGYVALDMPCEAAKHLAKVLDDPEPQPPDEPDEDADAATIEAYQAADDKYDADLEAWEERQTAALPTYRNLLAGAGGAIPTVLVQHARSGTLVECVAQSDLAPVLRQQGIEPPPPPPTRGSSNPDREREKVARQETAYRQRLAACIVFSAGTMPFDMSELQILAHTLYQLRDFETQKLIVKMLRGGTEKIERADTYKLAADIMEMDKGELYGFLRLATLAGHIHVASYSNDPTSTPTAMATLADRWGVDPEAVRKQVADDAAAKKPGKAKD